MPLFDNQGNIAVPTTGDDVLVLKGINETVNGDAGNDDLTDEGSGTGNTLNGNAGNDTLFGGTEGFLNGDTGRDIIFASPNGSGGNTITGGSGRDLFVIATAEIPQTANIIKDFNSNLDFIGLSLLPDVDSFDDLTIVDGEGEDEGNTIISFGDDRIAILEGITADSLTPIDVIILGDGPLPVLPNSAPTISTSDDFQYDDTIAVGTEVGTFTFGDVDQDELIITGNNSNLFTITFNANDALSGGGTGTITIAEGANLDLFTPEARFTLNITVTDNIAAPVSTSIDILGVAAPPALNLDIDGNSQASPGTDGILVSRYLIRLSLGFDGLNQASLTNAVSPDATRTDLAAINDYLADLVSPDNNIPLDIDGNDEALPGTDGILVSRYLIRLSLGFDGLNQASLTNAVAPDATRTDLAAINDYLADLMPQT